MRAQLVRWAVLAIAVPLAATVVKKLADRVEGQRGPTSRVARGLRKAGEMVRPTKR